MHRGYRHWRWYFGKVNLGRASGGDMWCYDAVRCGVCGGKEKRGKEDGGKERR